MTPRQFDEQARAALSTVLKSHGFEVSASRQCTFYRRTPEDLWHFVMPDPGTRGSWYDIKVFASSPAIEPLFHERFPDDLGIPADVYCYLHPRDGVGMRQKQYPCRTPEGFRREFDSVVASALTDKALPYLDGIPSLPALVPHIRHKLYLGFALHATGQREAAAEVLKQERARLLTADTSDRKVAVSLSRIAAILGSNGS
jgi:hypothetical protein